MFDMDGVLVDSERPSLGLLRALLAEHGVIREAAELTHVCGRPEPYMRAYLGACLGHEAAVAPFLERYGAGKLAQLEAGEVRVFEYVHDVLTALHAAGVPLAVATSTQRDLAMRRLHRFGLAERFDAIVTGDEVTNGKPAPDIFLRAAEALGTSPGACVAIEDSVVGVEAAERAGMTVVALATTFPAEALARADHVLPDMRALLAFVTAR